MVAQIAPPPIALVVNKIAGPQPTIPPVAGGEELFYNISKSLSVNEVGSDERPWRSPAEMMLTICVQIFVTIRVRCCALLPCWNFGRGELRTCWWRSSWRRRRGARCVARWSTELGWPARDTLGAHKEEESGIVGQVIRLPLCVTRLTRRNHAD